MPFQPVPVLQTVESQEAFGTVMLVFPDDPLETSLIDSRRYFDASFLGCNIARAIAIVAIARGPSS